VEGGDAEVNGVAAGDESVDLGEFGVGGGEADLEPFGFACPAFPLGFVDAGGQVVVDVQQSCPLVWVDSKEGASDTAVLMNTAGPVGSSAVTEGDPPAFEVAEELLPLFLGWAAVFLAGTQFPSAGDE
jgi:hypothetical protein